LSKPYLFIVVITY